MKNQRIDMVGQRFGNLVVIRPDLTHPKSHSASWVCLCDCGREKIVTRGKLLKDVKSCGCYRNQLCREGALKHGYYGTKINKCWGGMMTRCYNPNSHDFKNYGGRGISVCERWHDFRNFLEDMGEKPPGLTIGRINNDGNYEPGNCRWESRLEQQNNRRTNTVIELDGLALTVAQWSRKTGINETTILYRLKIGWSPSRILTEKVRGSKGTLLTHSGTVLA